MAIKTFSASKLITWKNAVLLFFCLYLYFPLFLHLDVLPVNLWDEALFALRALYMLQHGEYLYNFDLLQGLTSHPNTKLPFTTFLQVLGLKIFGINELGLRLPISFIFLGTVFYICYYSKKYLGSLFTGVCFGVLLVSSTGFVDLHMLRTGDQDAPFACYLILATFFFHRFLETSGSRPLIGFSFFMIAAFLTKNLLAGLVFPGLLAYVLYRRSFLSLLKDYRVYVALFVIFGTYAGTVWYFDSQHPGFFRQMWDYELMGRYSNEIEGHGGGALFYIKALFLKGFRPFGFFMFISLAFLLDKNMKPGVRNLLVLGSLVFLSYLLVISFSETKTSWYAAPLYPLAALIVSLGAYHFYDSYISRLNVRTQAVVILSALVFTSNSYAQVIESIYMPAPIYKDHKYGIFIDKVKQQYPELKTFTIADNSYGLMAFFIKEEYNTKGEGYNIKYQRAIKFEVGQYVMTCLNNVFNPLREKYDYEILHQGVDCKLLKITGIGDSTNAEEAGQ